MVEHYEWKKKFALLPAKVEGRWIWLRYYEAQTDYYRAGTESRRLMLKRSRDAESRFHVCDANGRTKRSK